jgi:hypothetical protein
MTTGTNPDVSPARRRWAAAVLGVSEDASRTEARRAYLRKLPDSDFLPPRCCQEALRVLAGRPAAAESDEEWLVEEESRLGAEVASFAAEFFNLPVPQRRQRWEALLSGCRDVPPLVARLQALKAGLEVENRVLPADPPLLGRLAGHLLEAFPLPPLARAASRQEFLRWLEGSPAESHKLWEKAVRYLRAEWSALAALDDELVRHVAELRSRRNRRRKLHCRSQQQLLETATPGSNRTPWKAITIVALIVVIVPALLSALQVLDNSPSPPAPSPGYSRPREDVGPKDLENLRLRIVTDPKTGQTSIHSVPPPLHELFDPSKYDVEIINPEVGGRVLRCTPRLGSATTGPAGQPVLVGEATLRLLGASREQIDALCSRAVAPKPRDGTPNSPAEDNSTPQK